MIDVSKNRIIDSKNITKSPTDIIYDSTNKKIFLSTNEINGSIKVIDSNTREIKDFVKIVGEAQAIGFDSLNGNLYVLNKTSTDTSSKSTVTIINTSTKKVFNPIPIKVGSPINFGFDSNHGHMYITSANGPEALYVIDAQSKTIIDTFDRRSGLDFSLGMDFNKYLGHMYIANAGSHVFIIDTNDRSKHINFPSGNGYEPVDIAFDTIHRHLYVVNKDKDSVTVIKSAQFVKEIQDIAEREDVFGSALASGDFNKDGFEDLAIGVTRRGC